MEDLYYAGGLPAVLKELDTFLHADCMTVNGKKLKDNYASAECYNREVVARAAKPFNPFPA